MLGMLNKTVLFEIIFDLLLLINASGKISVFWLYINKKKQLSRILNVFTLAKFKKKDRSNNFVPSLREQNNKCVVTNSDIRYLRIYTFLDLSK